MKKLIYFYFPKTLNKQKLLFVVLSFSLVFSTFGLFNLNDTLARGIGSIDDECQAKGFDYGVAKWEWSNNSYTTDNANGTNVTGDNNQASWTANPAVAGVIRKAGTTSEVFPGGTSGNISADNYGISHLTLCQNEQVISTYCELTLTKTDFAVTTKPGEQLSYQIKLKNTGTANCTGGGVKLRDYFSQQTSYVSANPAPAEVNDTYLEWNFGTMTPGTEKVVDLTVLVDTDTDCDSNLTNKVKYWSDQTSWGDYVLEDTPVQCDTTEPYCGDGNLDQGEQCDDGNNLNGDGCSASCQLESEPLCPVPVDLMLVVDRSGSMSDFSYCDGNTNITSKTQCILAGYNWIVEPMTSTKNAASYFVGKFDSSKDLIGLVSYATNASLESGLTDNFTTINNEINDLNPNGYTNIGGAIKLANTELTNHNRTAAAPVIVLLTDGKANVNSQGNYPDYDGGADYALAEALAAKNNGFTVYTIGLGPDVSHTLLGNIASTPDKYFYAPTVADLQSIYNEISLDICEYSSIAGCKYNDKNNNGSIDEDENTLTGWTIKLSYEENNEPVTQTMETDENGCYAFTNLSPNQYSVSEVNQAGWQQTWPVNESYNYSLGYGQLITDANFANYQTPVVGPYCGDGNLDQGEQCDDGNNLNNDGCDDSCQIEYGTLNGCKYKDLNNNGTIDNDEPTISQWPIVLTDEILGQANPIATSTTDLNGCYSFSNLEFGKTYIVAEEQVPGWQQTFPQPTSTYTILIASTQPYDNLDFANYQTPVVGPYCGDGNLDQGEQCDDGNNLNGDGCSASCQIEYSTISGCKYADNNNNGIIDIDEPTIPNWSITLNKLDQSGQSTSTTTNTDGCYSFSQLLAGNYEVREVQQNGWEQTYPTSTTYQVSVTNPGEYDGYNFANYHQPEPPCTNCGGGGGGPVNPILTITKSANVTFTNPGGIVDYTISIKNVGNATGLNLRLTDVLPTGLSYYATTTNGIWELGNIAINETKTVTYQVLFADNLAIGNYTNTAKAEITNGTPVTDTAVVEVRIPTVYSQEYEPILAIEKKVNMKFSNPNGEVTYTVTITNTNSGNLTAENVNLIDRLPKEFYFNSNKVNVNSWSLGDLQPGESKTISYEVTIKGDTKNGVYENIAIASADNAPEVSARTPLEIRDVKALGIVLPDTDGSGNQLLTVLLGLLIMAGGYVFYQLKQEYKLV